MAVIGVSTKKEDNFIIALDCTCLAVNNQIKTWKYNTDPHYWRKGDGRVQFNNQLLPQFIEDSVWLVTSRCLFEGIRKKQHSRKNLHKLLFLMTGAQIKSTFSVIFGRMGGTGVYSQSYGEFRCGD